MMSSTSMARRAVILQLKPLHKNSHNKKKKKKHKKETTGTPPFDRKNNKRPKLTEQTFVGDQNSDFDGIPAKKKKKKRLQLSVPTFDKCDQKDETCKKDKMRTHIDIEIPAHKKKKRKRLQFTDRLSLRTRCKPIIILITVHKSMKLLLGRRKRNPLLLNVIKRMNLVKMATRRKRKSGYNFQNPLLLNVIKGMILVKWKRCQKHEISAHKKKKNKKQLQLTEPTFVECEKAKSWEGEQRNKEEIVASTNLKPADLDAPFSACLIL